MAFSPFTAGLFTAGQVLTAAQMNTYIRDNIMAGGPVYATEAARNADIPTPYEGQRAYITGSTIAAATGLVTAVPTGIQTIHNGSSSPTYAANWVCVTPVNAQTQTTGTTTSATFTATLTSGGTNPSVTLSTGTTALIQVSITQNATSAFTAEAGVAVSGATTAAALSGYGTYSTSATFNRHSDQFVISGLTAGTNTFALNYITAGGTASFAFRHLTVQGIA